MLKTYDYRDFRYTAVILPSDDLDELLQLLLSITTHDAQPCKLEQWGERISDDLASEVRPIRQMRGFLFNDDVCGVIPWRCDKWLTGN